jgi:hypothetical protein
MLPVDGSALMLSDALDRTAVNPTGSHCWLNLIAQTRAVTEATLLEQAIVAVKARIPDEGLAGFYRSLYLDLASGDFRHLGRAAALLTTLAPRDQDRLVSFFRFGWQRALLYAKDRPSFIRLLHVMGLPALAPLIGYPAAPASRGARPSGALARVALVAPELLSPRHPPTRMLLEQAEVLIQNGIAVSLFACQESMGPDFAHLLGQGAGGAILDTDIDEWMARAPAGTGLSIASPRFSLMRRWYEMLPQIEAAQPDLVLVVGLHSGLIANLYARYPVLGLATNSMAPLVPTDVWLTAQPALDGVEGDYWRTGQPASRAWYHPFRARRRDCGAAVARSSLSIPDDAVLMISVGNMLAEQIDPAWAERMGAILAAHPQLHWLLLGGAGQLPPALAPHALGRVHCIAHSNNAMALMAMSDIYLQPPVMGGGLSVSEAMSLGLPVLSLADCDGGDKLGPAAAADAAHYFALLERWIADPAARASAGAALRQHFAQHIDLDASGPSLLGACRLAQQRYLRRCG